MTGALFQYFTSLTCCFNEHFLKVDTGVQRRQKKELLIIY